MRTTPTPTPTAAPPGQGHPLAVDSLTVRPEEKGVNDGGGTTRKVCTERPREGAGASAERSNGKRRAPSGATGGPSSELEKEILSSTCASWRGVGEELASWRVGKERKFRKKKK